ncbi:MAG: MerR family transcriptional regulator [Chloroflexi bacterium]|nr:MerR family transcriptional regulator [Chloroflexota bacterium]
MATELLLEKLRLSVGEAARVTGASVRQVSYWTQKGLVRAIGTPTKRRYDFRALERIALIKQHLAEGYALEEAAREADRLQRAARAAKLALVQEPQELIQQRLAELEELVGYLRRRLAQGAPRAQLASTADKLAQLDLRSLVDEHPPLRRRLLRVAAE